MKQAIRIPAIIDATGRWAANGSSSLAKNDPDWPWIDEMADYENDLVCPRRFWITVEVELPTVGEVTGVAEEEPSA